MDINIPSPVLQSLAAFGAVVLIAQLLSFLRLVLSIAVLPGVSLSTFGKKGSWALVTGASDGIGKEFSLQLAAKGFNIILVSRTASKLDTLASELQKKYSVQTSVLPLDFSAATDSDYQSLEQKTKDLDIAILVNNVGVSHDIPVPFLETPLAEMQNIIAVNCNATLRVTRIIAPAMVRRKRGLILTMASFGGVLPTPLLATYSGSKAFLQQWSTSLGSELEGTGVKVQLVQSYLVTSAMSKIRRASLTIPSPKTFVRSTINSVGRSGGMQGIAYSGAPYWAHSVMLWALRSFTGTMNKLVVGQNKSMHQSIRKRALKKKERDGKRA